MTDAQVVKHDHNDHIVRTKEQWDDRAIANYPIPRGVLCIELTSKTETRLKIGEGDKFYRQLPYIGGSSGDLSNYYTKQEIDNIIANLNFMSIASTRIYDSKSQLPLNGNKLGDLRFVRGENPTDDPFEYIWNGNKWIQIGGYADIDLSKYVTREEIMPRIQSLERSSHTHSNKSILDQITASYTIEEKRKLAGLKNYDDTEIKQDISELQSIAHTHVNKSILDQTTAPFTREEKQKLAELENYTLPIASADTLGGIKVGANLSIDQDGVLSATGGGSGGGGGNLVNGVATTVSSVSVDTNMYTDVQWDQGSIAQNGDLARNDRIRTHDYFPITIPSDGKITLIAHDTNDAELTWNIMLYTADQQLLLDSPWTPCGSELNLLEYIDTGKLARYVLCYPDNDPISPSNLKDAILRMTNTAIDVNYGSGLTVNQNNELEVSPATTTDIGGVKVGSGLSITSDGTLTANAGNEYVAGDGISIDQGSTESTDITDLQWEQGSINPVNGEPDDFTMTVIRSPMIEVGLTNMLNVSAQDTSDNDMRWKAAFYDSNSEFISMTSTWQTLSDEVIRPDNAKYVIILLRKDAETEIDENALKACEISWPIEIGKYVITNTGVTHIGLNENGSIIGVENGSTNTILEFSQDLDVTNGVVSIPDYHRLILNVEN